MLSLGTQETLQSEDIIPTLLATLSYTQRLIATLPTLTSLTVAMGIQHVASTEAFESFRADLEPYMPRKSGHLRHVRVVIDCFAYDPMEWRQYSLVLRCNGKRLRREEQQMGVGFTWGPEEGIKVGVVVEDKRFGAAVRRLGRRLGMRGRM